MRTLIASFFVLLSLSAAAVACPQIQQGRASYSVTGQDLYSPNRYSVTAGGNQNLRNCGWNNTGYVISQPDFSFYTSGMSGYGRLEIEVTQAACDTILLVNSANTEVLETPKQITLPASVVEEKPRETVVIFVSADEVTVQGEVVARVADILSADGHNIAAIGERLARVNESVIGVRTQAAAESREVTLLVDRSVPFQVVKKVMSTCTSEGFGRISLAVLQKAPDAVVAQS